MSPTEWPLVPWHCAHCEASKSIDREVFGLDLRCHTRDESVPRHSVLKMFVFIRSSFGLGAR